LRGLPAGPNAQAVLVPRLKGGEKKLNKLKKYWRKNVDVLLAILG
jgi:hypothetical protein